jgi:hypothetical protein
MGTPGERERAEGIAALPYVDQHAVEVGAGVEETWAALLDSAERPFTGGATPRVAWALGCEDTAAAGPRPLAVGAAIPGFHVAVARAPGDGATDAPAELALAGRHRFSRYALIFRVEPRPGGGSRLRAETRAEFPGLHGAVYRALVVGTRGHVLVTRRLLGAVKRRAERAKAT